MSSFRYRAVSSNGDVRNDIIEAETEAAAVEALRAAGLIPIRIAPGARHLSFELRRSKRHLRPRELALASRQIATLIEAGLTVERALQITAELQSGPVATAFGTVLQHVRGGKSLADSLALEGSFGPFYIGLVRAGEASGTVEHALTRLAEHQEYALALQEEVQSALVYPAIVLLLTVVSIIVMFTAVVPQFRPIFEDAGERLPSAARVVLAVSDGIENNGAIVALAVVAIVALVRLSFSDERLRRGVDRLALRVPLLGALVVRTDVARFMRALGVLLKSGITIVAAMAIARGAVSNEAMSRVVGDLATALRTGTGLWQPMQKADVFPPIVTQLVRTGEETGRLDDMSIRIADILDAEVRKSIKRLVALLVPALTVAMGLIVAATVGSVLTAILSVYELAR